jgi:hypothetical protein
MSLCLKYAKDCSLKYRPTATRVCGLIPSPRSISSIAFSDDVKCRRQGRGVFKSASRNWHCHPFLNWKYMYTRRRSSWAMRIIIGEE